MLSIGVVKYLNSLPFIAPYLLKIFPSPCEWVLESPKMLNQLCLEKQLSFSFVSSLFYLEHQDKLDLISGIGIGADGPVGSVSLFYPEALSGFHGVPITLDPESATSNGILKWYLEKIRGERPHYIYERKPDSAFLLIGDRCLAFGHPEGFKKIDLSEEWKRFTNLPLPFAVLVGQKGVVASDIEQAKSLLLAGLRWSKENPEQVALYAKEQMLLSEAAFNAYVAKLRYLFDSRFETALIHLERDVLKRVHALAR